MDTQILQSHKFIVLDGGHFNPLGIVRSLGEEGVRPDVVAIDCPNAIMTKSKYVNKMAFVKTAKEGVEYILKTYANEKEKSFLLTGSDSVISVIDSYYNQLKENFYVFNCGSQNGINKLLSKYEQNVLARKAGLNVPDFEEVQVGDLPRNVKYPLLTKAASSLEYDWKSLTHICRNEVELMDAYSTMNCERVLLQSYIEKENETGFDALSINQGAECYMPLQLTYHYTTETSFGNSIYFFKPQDNDLSDKIKRLMELTGFEGVFSVDFIVGKDNKFYFLEVNFRNSAWSYPSTCAGVNLPIIWAKSTLARKLDLEGVMIKKTPYSAIDEITDLTLNRKKSLHDFLNTIKMVLKSDSYITWNLKDSIPFWYTIKRFIATHIL